MRPNTNLQQHPVIVARNERVLDEVSALHAVSSLLYDAGRNADCAKLLQTARSLLAHTLPTERKYELLAAIDTLAGLTLVAMGRSNDAGHQFEQAVDEFGSSGNLHGQYLALVAEGIRLQDVGQPTEALARLREAEKLDRTHNLEQDSVSRYKLQINIAGALSSIGDAQALVQQITSAMEWIPFEPCKQVAGLLLMKANYSVLLGDFEQGVQTYKQARAVAEQLGNAELQARLHARLALCYREWWGACSELGLLEESISYRHLALELYRGIGQFGDALDQWKEIVLAYKRIERIEQARDAAQAGMDLAQQVGELENVFSFGAEAAMLASSLGDYSGAISLYLQAFDTGATNRRDLQRVAAEIARNYYASGDQSAAVKWFEKSCDMLGELGDIAAEIQEREVLAYLLMKLGMQGAATLHLQRVRQLTELVQGNE